MPTYLIEGKKIRAEKPLTDAEIDEIASSFRAAAPAPAPAPDVTVTRIGDRQMVQDQQPRGFFERFAGVGPSVGIVDPSIPGKLTPEQLRESAEYHLMGASLATGPVLGAATRGVAAAIPSAQRALTPLATALETGGFRSGLGASASRAQQAAMRGVGGVGTGGAATALVSPEETAMGAGIGGALAIAAPPLAGIAGRAGGWVADLLSRRLPKVEANRLIDIAVRGELDQVRNAMLANPDALPSRVAADLNYPTLSAMLKTAEAKDPANTAILIRSGEIDQFVNQMAELAGGRTATAARTARAARRQEIVTETGDLREAAFAKARRTGEVMPLLEVIGTRARADAAEAVDFVRRMGPAIGRAEEWAKTWVASGGARPAGMPRPPAKYTYAAELAQFADEKMGEAAVRSMQAGGRARVAENTLQSMRDRGLTPIEGRNLISSLQRLLRDPEIAENQQARAGVMATIDAIGRWTNEVGVVTPEALYAIRKNAVSDAVRKLMPGADEKSVQRFAAKVLTSINPKLDDAIVRAGGTEWPQYLNQFKEGMDEIRKMAFFDEMRLLADKRTAGSREKLYKIIAGEDPKFIEEVFGPERFDINQMVPEQRQIFEDLLVGLRADRSAARLAKEGIAAMREAEEKIGSLRVRFPWFSRVSSTVNEMGRLIELNLDRKTQDAIMRAAQSGRNFAELLDQVPASQRDGLFKVFQNPDDWPMFVGQVAQAAQAQAQRPNMMIVEPEPQSRNAMAP